MRGRLVAVLAASLCLSGCVRVGIVGDSLTDDAAPAIHDATSVGYVDTFRYFGGTNISQIAGFITAIAPQDKWVVNAGTNDVATGNTAWRHDYDGLLAEVIAQPCVVLTTLSVTVDALSQNGVTAEAINAYLLDVAGSNSHIHIVDWNAAVQADSSLIAADNVHPTNAGSAWIGNADRVALDSCDVTTSTTTTSTTSASTSTTTEVPTTTTTEEPTTTTTDPGPTG